MIQKSNMVSLDQAAWRNWK